VSYERLKEVLEKLGESHLQVDRVLLVKFGCICLRDEASSSGMSGTHGMALLVDETKGPTPHGYISQALEKHGNVFDLKVVGEEEVSRLEYAEDNCMFVNGKTFFLRVKLPLRLQKYQKEKELAGISLPIEEFLVVSNGSLYATFAEIQEYPAVTFIGQEYREILAAQIDNETPFKHAVPGPSPIHPNFYIAFRKSTNHPLIGRRIYSKGNDIFVVMDRDKDPRMDEARATMLFFEIKFDLLQFYRTMMDQHVLDDRNELLLDEFSELGESFEEIAQTSLLHLLKRRKLAASARTTLSNIHIALVEHDRMLLEITRDRNRLLKQVKDNTILVPLYSYFHDSTQSEAGIPESLSPALEHFDAELQTFKNIEAVVLASIVGAGVGALLTGLFTRMW
jgi:hypothetical protein